MKNKLSRREFLHGGTAVLLSAALAACGANSTAKSEAEAWETATPAHVLASPLPPTIPEAEITGTRLPNSLQLEEFLLLSTSLTGFNNLDPQLGHAYLQSLTSSGEFDVSLPELYAQAGLDEAATAVSLADLEAAGIFEQEASQKLADKIIELWYTGTYTDAEGETAVATYVDALAWKSLDFTKPTTICGEPYFWAHRP